MTDSAFNSEELLQYHNATYQHHMHQAKQDKHGDTYKIYRSLESSSAWTTHKNAGNTAPNQTAGRTTSPGSSTGKGRKFNILSEISRSIQQQQHNHHQHKNTRATK